MNTLRSILSGALTWVLTFISFAVISSIPVLKNWELYQYLIIYGLLVPIVLFGARFYYKRGGRTNGLLIGIVMVTAGMLLDIIITVPLVYKPLGEGYLSFFMKPTLWILIIEYVFIVYLS